MKKKKLMRLFLPAGWTLCIAFVFLSENGAACTIAIVCADAAADGRPLLWKNRDTGDVHNELKAFDDGVDIGGYIGLVSTDNGEDDAVWSGVNDAGFGIVNSLVDMPGYSTLLNGVLMKQALMTCRTAADFEALLAAWTRGEISADFGVIDAFGGAALFEVRALEGASAEFIRTAAADTRNGFIVMANANSFTPDNDDIGDARKHRAESLLHDAAVEGALTARFLLRYAARDMAGMSDDPAQEDEFDTLGFISRYYTRAATVLHGVREGGEDPRLSTLWTLLGEPTFGVAVPAFSFAHVLPDPLTAAQGAAAPLNALAEEGELTAYLNNTDDRTMRSHPLFYPESAHFSILGQHGFVEDQVLLFVNAALSPLRSDPDAIRAETLIEIQEKAAGYAVLHFWQ
jgi:hypothetical protein